MVAIKASEAKQKFGFIMDMAIKEPVLIEKHGRPYVVLISNDYYEFLKEVQGNKQ